MQHLTAGTDFDNLEFYNKLVDCLNQTDPLLYKSVNSQWERLKEFSDTGGVRPSKDDVWYNCTEDGTSLRVKNPNKHCFKANLDEYFDKSFVFVLKILLIFSGLLV